MADADPDFRGGDRGCGKPRLLLDVAATSRQDQAKLQAEVLVLRRQVQVLERQIKRVQWSPADRMILAALRARLPRTAWVTLLVRPETVLGWHPRGGEEGGVLRST